MNVFYLNTILPDLFLNENLTKQFYLPFNVAGILIVVEKKMFKPIWITTSLLQLTQKETFTEKKSIPKIDFLIKNEIIPSFNLANFTKFIEIAVATKNEVKGEFLQNDEINKNTIELEYEPKFLPIYRKGNEISHVLFYLEPIKEESKFSFNQLEILSEEIERVKSINKELFTINKFPIVEINKYLKIENYNASFESLFPKLKDSKNNNFLDFWTFRNQSKIADCLYKVKINQEEELIIFEEFENELKKLKLKFKNNKNFNNYNCSTLVTIENLNLENEKDKELTKKGYLLNLTQVLSYELEENEDNFLFKTSQYIINNFDFNGMYFLEFNQESKEKFLITFPKIKKEQISLESYKLHETNFKPIIKRNLKRLSSKKFFNEGSEFEIKLLKSPYLLCIPIYEKDNQKGVMVYLCDSQKIDIDSAYQLYSLTTILYKIYKYQNILITKENLEKT